MQVSSDAPLSDAESLEIAIASRLAEVTSLDVTDNHRSLFDLPVTTNPHFAGSAAIDGADADLIVDHQLIEIKTTVKATLGRDWVWQLIGYLLLDWDDAHEISGRGLYSSRHGILVTWSLNEFLSHASKQQPRSVAGLREEFRKIVVERERI